MIDTNELRVLVIYLPDDDRKLFMDAIDRLEAAEKERDALRAKVAEMERQEPVATKLETPQFQSFRVSKEDADKLTALPVGAKLYALPGAQPAPSIPGDVMRDAKRYRFLRAAKNIPISTEAARDPVVYDAAIDAAMLARAPEAKP